MVTMESIFSYKNLLLATEQVIANRGAAGTDGLTVDDIKPWFRAHPHKLTKEIMEGTYQFHPIKRVYIPKSDGKQRPLGIPSVIDRVVQQAIAKTLSEEYDNTFSSGSYGFRPDKSGHDAVKAVTA